MDRTQNLLPTLTIMEVDVVMFQNWAKGVDHLDALSPCRRARVVRVSLEAPEALAA